MHETSGADRIRSYFAACTSGTAEEISAKFTDGAVIYDTNHRPVETAEGIGRFWTRVREQWSGAAWTVDTVVEQDDAAAIEWTMTGVHRGTPFAVRGSEHYRFVDDRIDEIRQYWTFDPDAPASELVGFPYADRAEFTPPQR